MTTQKSNKPSQVNTDIEDIEQEVKKHIIELIEPYIDIDYNLPLDALDPLTIAEETIVHYADSEHIL